MAETVDVSRSASGTTDVVAPATMLVVWRRWWGAPDLVRRACRVMAESAGATETVVEVCVRDDVERVAAAGFPDEVTGQALREWRTIVAHARGAAVELRMEITRERMAGAVVLRAQRVGTGSAADLDAALAPLIPVLERGRPRHGESPRLVTPAAGEEWRPERGFPKDRLQSWVTGILVFCLLAPILAIDATLPGAEALAVSFAFFVIFTVVLTQVAAGAIAAALPAITLDETTAWPRVRRLLVIAASAAVSTAIGAAVKTLIGWL